MMARKRSITACIGAAALATLAGCASVPSGPSVMALPGTGKSFDQFRADDAECRLHARQLTGGEQAERFDTGARSAALGTVVGAVAGAAIGGRDAAGVGAGSGLIIGSLAGAEANHGSGWSSQRHYDNAYVQCMYGKGQKVPVPADLARNRSAAPAETGSAAPVGAAYPPPPDYRPPPGLPYR